MTSSKLFDNPTVPPLRRLIEDVIDGGILVPEFQRKFEWSDEQRLDLLDSVLCGMPIGSLLVWRTRLTGVQHRSMIGPRAVKTSEVPDDVVTTRAFLLDGLQRVSTLVGALAPREKPYEEEQDGGDEPRWTIYYNLAASPGTSTRDRLSVRSRRRGATIEATHLPLHLVLDDFEMGDFQDRLKATGFDVDARRAMVRESQRVAALIKDYPVPVVPIVSDDLDVVTTSFQRVNSMGTRMSEEDMAAALTFARGIKLPSKIEAMSVSLGEVGWAALDSRVILLSLKVALGIEPSQPQPTALQSKLVAAQQRNEDPFDPLTRRMIDALKFLGERCDIRGPGVLPYAYQIVSLCEAAGANDFTNEAVRARYAMWFWATTVSEHFASMNSTQLARTIEFARVLGHLPESDVAHRLRVEVGAEKIRRVSRFNFNAARSRAFCVMLAEYADRVTESPAALDLLGAEGNGAVQVLALGVRQSEPGNRVVLPPTEIGELRELLRGPESDEVLRAADRYQIPREALVAWRQGEYEAFVTMRGAYLWEREKSMIESRVPHVFEFED